MPKVTNCPHCTSALIPHEGVNDGFAHCNACGCCFVEATGELRPGTQMCNPIAADLMAQHAVKTEDVQEMEQRIKTLEEELEAKNADIDAAIEEGTVAVSKVIADNDEANKAAQRQHEAEVKALNDQLTAANKAHEDEIKALNAKHAEELKTATAAKSGDNK